MAETTSTAMYWYTGDVRHWLVSLNLNPSDLPVLLLSIVVVGILLRLAVLSLHNLNVKRSNNLKKKKKKKQKQLISNGIQDEQLHDIVHASVQRKQDFLEKVGDDYGYPNSPAGFIDHWRHKEFPALIHPLQLQLHSDVQQSLHTNNKDKEVYLDHAGSSLPSQSLLHNIYTQQISQTAAILANPHSGGPAASRTLRLIEQVKKEILDHFHGHPGRFATLQSPPSNQEPSNPSNLYHPGYDIIFTSGTTEALRIVAEHFPWTSHSTFLYPHNAHTSVIGMRGPVLDKGAGFVCKHLSDITQLARDDDDNHLVDTLKQWQTQAIRHSQPSTSTTNQPEAHNLLLVPAECNFGGDRPDCATLVQRFRQQQTGWSVMLDLAKAASTGPINLQQLDPDFACVSFYKLFGAPTGLGALFVRRQQSKNVLLHNNHNNNKHHYFGGGSVDVVVSNADFAVRKSNAGLTHGTSHFRGIVALSHGLHDLNHRLGGMHQIQQHTHILAHEFCQRVQALSHANNGRPAVVLYGAWGHQQPQQNNKPGPVVAFNICRSDGSIVGYTEVSKLAGLYNPPLQLRTGCFCNPGACQDALGLTNDEIIDNYQTAGHVCGDEKDVINGKPSGAIRASFGKDSLWEDMDALVMFIQKHFVVSDSNDNDAKTRTEKKHSDACTDTTATSTARAFISEMYIYPIKSCAAQQVDRWTLTSPSGRLQYDREFALVDSFGTAMRLQRFPKMGTIRPCIDPREKTLTVSAPGMEDLVVRLDKAERCSNDDDDDDMKSLVSVCGNKCSGELWGGMAASEWFSGYLGVQCWLARYSTSNDGVCKKRRETKDAGEPNNNSRAFSNEKPILLLSKLAVAKLNAVLRHQGQPTVTAKHFRPNLVVDIDSSDSSNSKSFSHPEDTWTSVTIVQSGTKLLNAGLCARCAMVDVDPTTGTKGKTLQALAEYRREGANINFGIFLQSEGVGHDDEVLEQGCVVEWE
ncbi:Molybdenum cofactor sulfurase [Seminavis robusta]|uniref:Molybdenum cofactor sulfurase n=1 Tax=Seminavis robusta TaxID=568900 RepID=A0A9N8EP05_9STRA|nr:Molybdenum cofactor sulfurase [Seminavis robusta]|eukprot:Sro1460_g274650.1 Molybdenum cofactor sulfurase (973) ;mRNA; r:18173-21091